MTTAPRRKEDGSPVRAIGLLSGGLDSTLAAKVVRDQGIEVVGVNFATGFCRSDHHRAMGALGKEQDVKRLRNEALRAGSDLEIPVRIVDISADYLDVILAPKHGYGANMNPCIDCRAYMLRAARAIMDEEGADFVFTGEVLGQRPMSQHLRAMKIVEREGGLEGLLLRPLSARLLSPTEPEKRGWVDRQQLLRIQGRTRREQMRLAGEAELTDIPSPAGGCCFLTDEVYASRFHDLLTHMPPGEKPSARELLLLKVGRHFRLSPRLRLVVGREEAENRFLQHFFPDAPQLEAAEYSGPLAVVHGREEDLADGVLDDELLRKMAAIVARYGKGRAEEEVDVVLRRGGDERTLRVAPTSGDEELDAYRISERFDAASLSGRVRQPD